MEALADGDPRTIGRYRLEARLGHGGMGVVFLGRSPSGRAVAVKIVRPELSTDQQFRQRFAAEVEAARRVGGFHTTPVVDADPEGDPPWLVTAYIPGPSLAQAIAAHGPLPEHSLKVLAAGLAEALEAIHAEGLVHRDLKPSNILLADDGPRVIDFGIARALDGTAITRSGGVVGTPGFMAPEQITGAGSGPAADVFAFGSVLCQAAGVQPFGEGPTTAMLYRVVHQEPDLGGLPGGLLDLVASCLAKDPAQRPTPAQLLERLSVAGPTRAWLPHEVQSMLPDVPDTPARPAPPRTAPRGVRFPGVKAWPAIGLASYLVGLVISGFMLFLGVAGFLGDSGGDGPVPLMVALLGILGVTSCLRGMWARINTLSRPYDLSVGPGGLDLRHSGRHTIYHWADINRVAVRRGAEKRAWSVCVSLVPGSPPPPAKDFRAPFPHLEKKTGWIVLALTRELSAPRADIEAALARFAGPRWGGNG
ncbi:serine/threonine-protein kinase [Actinomadura rugatobispora]|uniref:Serine/threonine-protein kinase n=1 Tax=Actinomadura rugatobispora TaxID=1994 RepID=A0ABW1AGU9_9ACTN|nr:hypothetical protein GCM10010200_046800 [Actinomadura rugatobispora]